MTVVNFKLEDPAFAALVAALAWRDEVAAFAQVDRVLEREWDPRQFLFYLRAELNANNANNNSDLMRGLTEIADHGLREMEGSISPRLLLELTCARMLLPTQRRESVFS